MKNTIALLAIVLAACLLLAGCQTTPQDQPESDSPGTETPSPQDGADLPEAQTDDAPETSPPELPQSIGLVGGRNTRHLGGYATADGRTTTNRLLRSGILEGVTDDDIARLTQDCGLTLIVDLRQPTETVTTPTPAMDCVDYINLSLEPPKDDGGTVDIMAPPIESDEYTDLNILWVLAMQDVKAGMQHSYLSYVTNEHSIAMTREIFDVLLEHEDGAVLWHCTSGKDRTGMVSALVLTALGVDRETIVQDFLLTNDYLAEMIAGSVAGAALETDNPDLLEGVRLLNGVDESYIEAAFAQLEESYGSVEGYLREAIGLTDEDFETLREKYTQ